MVNIQEKGKNVNTIIAKVKDRKGEKEIWKTYLKMVTKYGKHVSFVIIGLNTMFVLFVKSCPTKKVINERLMDGWRKMTCEKFADQNYDCPDNQNGNCLDCRYGGISDEKIEYYKLYGKLKTATICNNDENMISIIKSKGGNWIGLM